MMGVRTSGLKQDAEITEDDVRDHLSREIVCRLVDFAALAPAK